MDVMRFKKRCFAVLTTAFVYATCSPAQTPAQGNPPSPPPAAQTAPANPAANPPKNAPQTTLSVDVKVVTLPVTVRDKHNQIVKGLTKADFTLTEDGHPQVIKYFNVDTNLPLTLGLLVDSSMSQRTVLDQEKTASKAFLDQMLTVDQDKAFVIHFDWQVELLQDLTSSRDKLRAAVDLVQESGPQMSDASESSSGGSSGGRHRGGGTQLYDSIYLASNELMKKQQGRKAIIVLTDGVDRGSKETLNTSIEAAQRADTVVYSIYFKGEHDGGNNNASNGYPGMGRHGGMGGGYPGGGYPGGGYPGGGGGYPRGGGGQSEPRVDGKKILQQMSGETGGRFFEVTKKETVDQIYATIEDELRSQYMLGYTPDKTNSGPGYHKLALTTDKKDVTVQTRAGYYADR
jgi:VWFA-related protein